MRRSRNKLLDMQSLQKIPGVNVTQQNTKSKTISSQALLLTSRLKTHCVSPAANSRSRFYHQSCAVSLHLLASRPKKHKCRHIQNQSNPPMRSTSTVLFARFATMKTTSGSTPSPTPHVTEPSQISSEQFHRLSDAYIDALVAKLEALQEKSKDVDVEYSAGVLSLVFPPAGTYVINKQPPNKQIWLSSPISGPKRYDWAETKSSGKMGQWVYLRDGSTLNELLVEEIGINFEDDWKYSKAQ